jgi:hypothetical protein
VCVEKLSASISVHQRFPTLPCFGATRKIIAAFAFLGGSRGRPPSLCLVYMTVLNTLSKSKAKARRRFFFRWQGMIFVNISFSATCCVQEKILIAVARAKLFVALCRRQVGFMVKPGAAKENKIIKGVENENHRS